MQNLGLHSKVVLMSKYLIATSHCSKSVKFFCKTVKIARKIFHATTVKSIYKHHQIKRL